MPLPSATYCVLASLPLDVEVAGGWRLSLTDCAQGVYCYFQETGGSLGERLVCSGETEAWVRHHLGVIGVQVGAGTVQARLFEQLVREGRAERLPRPRHWREYPYPQVESLNPFGHRPWAGSSRLRAVG